MLSAAEASGVLMYDCCMYDYHCNVSTRDSSATLGMAFWRNVGPRTFLLTLLLPSYPHTLLPSCPTQTLPLCATAVWP